MRSASLHHTAWRLAVRRPYRGSHPPAQQPAALFQRQHAHARQVARRLPLRCRVVAPAQPNKYALACVYRQFAQVLQHSCHLHSPQTTQEHPIDQDSADATQLGLDQTPWRWGYTNSPRTLANQASARLSRTRLEQSSGGAHQAARYSCTWRRSATSLTARSVSSRSSMKCTRALLWRTIGRCEIVLQCSCERQGHVGKLRLVYPSCSARNHRRAAHSSTLHREHRPASQAKLGHVAADFSPH